jgi:hypothetical protein
MRTCILSIAIATSVVACSKSNGRVDSASGISASKPAANAEIAERVADSTQTAGVPAAVAEVGTHGEDLYDQVKAASWSKAAAIMDSLDRAVSSLKPDERAQLSGVLDTLRSAIAAHRKETALEAANRVTLIGAKLTEAYHPKMPADIVRLDYYGRELEIWAARKDMARLASTAAELRRTWEAVKPIEISNGGAAAAARTDSLVTRLSAAKSPADYAKLATPILDVVDELEKPFEK